MSSYWTYYLGMILLSFGLGHPSLLLGVAVLYVLRHRIPDPWVFLSTSGRIRTLRTDIAANSANLTARRDLAVIHLQRMRPRAALKLLDEARLREPESPELLYLTGVARLRSGDAAGAVEPLVQSVQLDGKLRRGEPYLVAAEALMKVSRWDDAAEALELFGKLNKSSLEACVRRAKVARERGDGAGEKHALTDASDTWHQLPGFLRRKQFGWLMRAYWMRVM